MRKELNVGLDIQQIKDEIKAALLVDLPYFNEQIFTDVAVEKEQHQQKEPTMTTASAKSKGRSLQQTVRNDLRKIGVSFGLQDGDIESRGMGQNGTDVILSPAANTVFGRLAIECKNCETLNVTTTFTEHAAKYPQHISMLVHKKNKMKPLITMTLADFMLYFKESIEGTMYDRIGNKCSSKN